MVNYNSDYSISELETAQQHLSDSDEDDTLGRRRSSKFRKGKKTRKDSDSSSEGDTNKQYSRKKYDDDDDDDDDDYSKKYKRKKYQSDTYDDESEKTSHDEKIGRPVDDPTPPTENPKWYPPNFIGRQNWGSDEYGEHLYELQLATKVLITYSESDPCFTVEECKKSMRELQKRDKEAGFSDTKHNFYIGGDGNLYEGRGWLEIPDTPEAFESDRGRLLAVSMIGRRGQIPGDLRVKVFQDLVALGQENWLITPHARVTWSLKKPVFEPEKPFKPETIEATQDNS